MGWRKTYRYRAKAGKKTTEPGYRYAKEREAYLNLTPTQRQIVKQKMEAYWDSRPVSDAVNKNRVACPRTFED